MRMGPVNGGWKVAISTLSNESLSLTGNGGVSRNLIDPLLRLARRVPGVDGRPLIEDPAFRERIASYHVAVAGIDRIANRISTALSRGQNPGSEMYIGKMTLTRLLQSMSEFGMDLAGVAGSTMDKDDPDLFEIQQSFFLACGYRMGGGTEEIGKNIIAERVLGLPAEYRPDKNIAFNAIS
jgi:alkylation response protein AidB-like acyl-CoA dehydrogenase